MATDKNNLDTIDVTGICHKKVTPDRIRVNYIIDITEKSQKESVDNANKIYKNLLKELKKLKLKDLEEKTENYSVLPEYRWISSKRVFKGYKTNIHISVATSEKDKAGKLIALGPNLDVQNVRGPSSYVSQKKLKSIHTDCLKIAAADAENKADLLAQSLKVKRGLPRLISETSLGYQSRHKSRASHFSAMEKTQQAQAPAPEIKFGTQDISVQLHVRFAID